MSHLRPWYQTSCGSSTSAAAANTSFWRNASRSRPMNWRCSAIRSFAVDQDQVEVELLALARVIDVARDGREVIVRQLDERRAFFGLLRDQLLDLLENVGALVELRVGQVAER